jgi:transposase
MSCVFGANVKRRVINAEPFVNVRGRRHGPDWKYWADRQYRVDGNAAFADQPAQGSAGNAGTRYWKKDQRHQCGIIVRQGLHFLRQALPDILAKRTDVLSPRMVHVVADLASDWRQLDERIEVVTDEIETLAKSDDNCRRVMTVPGIGPIISSAMVAAIGSGAAFTKGRDFSAWIGLVPQQMSTGDRTILGRISKRGNGYLRMLFIQAARVILLRPASWPRHSFGVWLARAAQRLHPNVLAAAFHKSATMKHASLPARSRRFAPVCWRYPPEMRCSRAGQRRKA